MNSTFLAIYKGFWRAEYWLYLVFPVDKGAKTMGF
jgi:hypothetical protein